MRPYKTLMIQYQKLYSVGKSPLGIGSSMGIGFFFAIHSDIV
jgi:hypothetical protein